MNAKTNKYKFWFIEWGTAVDRQQILDEVGSLIIHQAQTLHTRAAHAYSSGQSKILRQVLSKFEANIENYSAGITAARDDHNASLRIQAELRHSRSAIIEQIRDLEGLIWKEGRNG